MLKLFKASSDASSMHFWVVAESFELATDLFKTYLEAEYSSEGYKPKITSLSIVDSNIVILPDHFD